MPSPTGKSGKTFPFFRVDRDVKMWYPQSIIYKNVLRMEYGRDRLCDPLPSVAIGEQVKGAFSFMNEQKLALIISGSLYNPLEIDWIRVLAEIKYDALRNFRSASLFLLGPWGRTHRPRIVR